MTASGGEASPAPAARACWQATVRGRRWLSGEPARPLRPAYLACVSRVPRALVPLPGRVRIVPGRVTDALSQLPPGRYDLRLCGPAAMVDDATAQIDACFPGSLVFREVFS